MWLLNDPRVFNYVIMVLYVANAGRWAWHGSLGVRLLDLRRRHHGKRHVGIPQMSRRPAGHTEIAGTPEITHERPSYGVDPADLAAANAQFGPLDPQALKLLALREAFGRLQTRLEYFCKEANAGRMPSDAREFMRRVQLGFAAAYEEAGQAPPSAR